MANLDSFSKRASLIQSLLPASTVLPAPDGTIDLYDRAHLAHLYSGQVPITYTMHVSDRPGEGHVQEFSVGDIIRVQALDSDGNISESWVQVVAATDQTTYWDYTVSLGSGGGIIYPEGTTLLDFGTSGEGIVRNISSGTDSPYIEALTHGGSPWSTVTAHAVLGNLEAFTEEAEWGIAVGADLTSLTGDYAILSDSRILFNADVGIASGKAIHHPDSSTVGWVLTDVSGDGNFYPAEPTGGGGGIDLEATEGALIYSNATPEWAVLAHPASAYQHLVTTAAGLQWEANPHFSEYLYHGGDEDTYIRFQDDQITLRAGTVDGLSVVKGAANYIDVGMNIRMNARLLYLDVDDDTYLCADVDDSAEFNIPTGGLLRTIIGGDTLFTVSKPDDIVAIDYVSDGAQETTGLDVLIQVEPSENVHISTYGINSVVRIDTARTIIGADTAVRGMATINNSIVAEIDDLIGVEGGTDAEDGVAIDAFGVKAITPNVDTGTVTNGYGVYVDKGTVGAGTLTNLYGIYIEDMDAGGTLNYSVYAAGGKAYFGGDGLQTKYLTGTMSYIPTDAEFDTITSSTPAGVGDGFLVVVKDTSTAMTVLLGSDGSNWLYWRGAVAA